MMECEYWCDYRDENGECRKPENVKCFNNSDTGWISVKGKMPADDEKVLVFMPEMIGSGCEIQISKGWATNKFVSHWMPMPEPPEVEHE